MFLIIFSVFSLDTITSGVTVVICFILCTSGHLFSDNLRLYSWPNEAAFPFFILGSYSKISRFQGVLESF